MSGLQIDSRIGACIERAADFAQVARALRAAISLKSFVCLTERD